MDVLQSNDDPTLLSRGFGWSLGFIRVCQGMLVQKGRKHTAMLPSRLGKSMCDMECPLLSELALPWLLDGAIIVVSSLPP